MSVPHPSSTFIHVDKLLESYKSSGGLDKILETMMTRIHTMEVKVETMAPSGAGGPDVGKAIDLATNTHVSRSTFFFFMF